MAPAALAADAHAGSDRDHAALAVRHAVDLGEAIEAHPHHAIGCALAASDRGVADRRQAGQQYRGGGGRALRHTDGPALDLDRDLIAPGRGPRQAAAGTSKRFAENGAMIGSSAPDATIGANRLACAPARVTPLWQFAVKAPG